MSDMSNYFEIADKRKAIMLDASNCDRTIFPMMSFIKDGLETIINETTEIGYDEPCGNYTLRNLIAIYESHIEKTKIYANDIIINHGGVTGSFDNVFRYISKESIKTGKDEIIIPVPCYPEISRSAIYNNLNVTYLQTKFENNFQPTLESIEKKLNNKTAAIFITSPGNPCSKYINNTELYNIVACAKKNDILVILDSIFEEATTIPFYHKLLAFSYDKIIKLKGMSKDRPYMNDFRVGWSITKNNNIQKGLSLASEVSGFSISMTLSSILAEEMTLRIARYNLLEKHKNDINLSTQELFGTSIKDFNISLINYILELEQYTKLIDVGLKSSIKLCQKHNVVDKICIPDAGNILFIKIKDEICKKFSIYNGKELFYHVLDNSNIAINPGDVFFTPENEVWFRVTMSKDPVLFTKYLKTTLNTLK